MLAENARILKNIKTDLYNTIREWEEGNPLDSFIVEKTRDDSLTLKYEKNDAKIYVHSKYNPVRESENLIRKLNQKEINESTHIVFWGMGFAYHIMYFIKKYPKVCYSIIEPSYEVFIYYLNNYSIGDLLNKRLVNISIGQEHKNIFEYIRLCKDKQIKIIELPVYQKIFPDEHLDFLLEFNKSLKNKMITMATNYETHKIWLNNCIKNFGTVLRTPNIFLASNQTFKKKTAIIVAAGPSLNDEIENLKRIKKEGLAYIFSVGSAINALIQNDLYPDAMCTHDPYAENQNVFKKVFELKINTIPMIFGSSVGYQTLEHYRGQKIHMIMNFDLISGFFLRTKKGKKIELIKDAPSIAVVTMEMLSKLGFEKILLVGQNLAYLTDDYYAKGIDYAPKKTKETLKIRSVNGNLIETDDGFVLMKEYMETMIAGIKSRVINTTKGGAKIEGADFIPLASLLEVDLNEKIVYGDEFKKMSMTNIYDENHLVHQMKKMWSYYKEYFELLNEIKKLLKKLMMLLNFNNEQEIINTQTQINNMFNEMEINDFFRVIGKPMNLSAYKIMTCMYEDFETKKSELASIRKMCELRNVFIDQLLLEQQIYEWFLHELEETIHDYKENTDL